MAGFGLWPRVSDGPEARERRSVAMAAAPVSDERDGEKGGGDSATMALGEMGTGERRATAAAAAAAAGSTSGATRVGDVVAMEVGVVGRPAEVGDGPVTTGPRGTAVIGSGGPMDLDAVEGRGDHLRHVLVVAGRTDEIERMVS